VFKLDIISVFKNDHEGPGPVTSRRPWQPGTLMSKISRTVRGGKEVARNVRSGCRTLDMMMRKKFHKHVISKETTTIIIIIRGATAVTNLGRLNSRRWQSFPTAPDGTGLTCGQHIESHSCIFSFPNRAVTSLFK
jgi:hypothetical protein